MEKGLQGKRVVIAASRKTDEMCTLVERQGGVGIVRSLQGTVFLAEKEVEPDLRWIVEEKPDWLILTTGVGAEALLGIAEKIGIRADVEAVIQNAKVARRGYKLVSVLRGLGVEPVAVDDDGTTAGLIRGLEPFDFSGQSVGVQLHGDPAPKLIQFLKDRGATVRELVPYQHVPPERAVVEQFTTELLAGEFDAVCFTTMIQVRFMFEYAREAGLFEQVLTVFREKTLPVAVGRVTAEALYDAGLEQKRVIVPELERMGAMIMELSKVVEAARV
ncbi:uroporphyrinogen-III synthase [Ammoniphilus oxalaticus]|uniref:Uroporphyrinogen-III synthase n=1 Tax=Ammoniphilus oxalaticus TaxID=66863 RepID=A0A419SHE8_9BACL|nr:uroporphyrinogen-III synthase [Ammoniphilus oxalaticus]RKD23193.1 uroporphyrinogen-III synthase [Ammoniphilus oxalaticus]